MERFLFILRILRYPLEVLYLSFDFLYALRASLRWITGSQKYICPFCRGEDDMEMVPRPSGMARKYTNLWLFRSLATCIEPAHPMLCELPFCSEEEQHFKRRLWLPALILLVNWSLLGAGTFYFVKNNPRAHGLVRQLYYALTLQEKPEPVTPPGGKPPPAPANPEDQFALHLDRFNQSGRLSEDILINERIYQHLIQEGDWTRAGIAAESQAGMFPDSATAREPQIKHLYLMGQQREFERTCSEVLAIDPANSTVHLLQAKAFHRQGLDQETREALGKVSRSASAGEEALAEAGLLAYLIGDDRTAWVCFNRCRELNEKSQPGLMGSLIVASRKHPEKTIDTSTLGGIDWTEDELSHIMLGHLYALRKDWSRSLKIARQVLERHPSRYDQLHWLAQVWREHGQLEAVLIMGDLLVKEPFNEARIFGHLLMARSYHQRKEYRNAILEIRRLLREDVNHLEAQLLGARCYFALEEWASALVHIKEVLRLDDRHLDAQLMHARALMQIADTFGSLDAYKEASRLHAEDPTADLEMARHYAGQKRYVQAIGHYEEALRRQPDNVEALNKLVGLRMEFSQKDQVHFIQEDTRALYNRGDLRAAFSFARDLKQHQELATALEGEYLLSELYFAMSRHNDSVLAAERIIATHPRHLDAQLLLVRNHEKTGDLSRAYGKLEYVLRRRPTDLQGWRVLGRMKKRDPSGGADRVFDRLILEALNPHLVRGLYMQAQGQYEPAQALLEKALQTEPDNPDVAYLLLNLLNLRKDQAGLGLGLVNQFGKKFPQHAKLGEASARYMILQSEAAEARKLLEEALKRFPRNDALHRMMGELLLQSGEKSDGLRHLETALNLSSDPLEAGRLRTIIDARKAETD